MNSAQEPITLCVPLSPSTPTNLYCTLTAASPCTKLCINLRPPPRCQAKDAAMTKETDRYARASHYLQEMVKAVVDDVVKKLDSPGNTQ